MGRQAATQLQQPGCHCLCRGGSASLCGTQARCKFIAQEVLEMRLRWFLPIAVLLPLRLCAADNAVKPRVATITINPSEVTTLHLRPEFESTIHMPEEITSVILGSPGNFKAEHNEGEPDYVYVKPITKERSEERRVGKECRS